MDTAIRRLTIAEQARRAAELAASTLQHQPNMYDEGTDEHREFAAAYARYFEAITTGVSSA
jgi:hypothetical protein